MPDRNEQLDQAEADFADAVAQALTDTAEEFADAVQAATELVAARFSVGGIARMWGSRVTGLVRRLLGVAETAAQAAAEDAGTDLSDGWDDLPGRYDDDRPLPDGIGQYVTTTEHLLRAVGDRLAEAARRELAAGVDAGEDLDQLRARLRTAFSREGANLGPMREERIARTEASRAWNTATMAAAQAMTGPDRPLVKQWITRHDARVRPAHDRVDAQLRLLDEPFTVAGVAMQAPGDPTAPPELVINCRCRLAVSPEPQTSAYEPKAPRRAHVLESEENSVEAPESVTAAGGHTGAMIALMPTRQDAERLALLHPGAEPADELHLTLFFLGKGADWAPEHRAELIAGLRTRCPDIGHPIAGRAFGANQWNADGDEPCWVWAVGDDRENAREDEPTLETVRWAAMHALEEMRGQPGLPTQHTPWQPHVCAAYTRSPALLTAMNQRLGPVRFDRLRVAFAGEYVDIPLRPEEEEAHPMGDDDLTTGPLAPRRWSTPDGTALVFENTETGDGRLFQPGALYWTGPGPWPLQHADEMLMGHQGAELAGAIQTITRDGDRIPGTGVLYPCRPAGADALMLLEQGAPLGVSVDLDDVTVEFVDRTPDTEGDGEGPVALTASLPSASVLRLDDGSWSLTATVTADWTASGGVLSRTAAAVHLVTGPGGRVTTAAVQAALSATGTLTAAAGDPDGTSGTVVHRESSGDLLMRITRARLRGATLVAMPAYDQARIVLDDPAEEQPYDDYPADEEWAATGPSPAHLRVITYVTTAPVPVGAREVATALRMKMETARGHLARAAAAGHIVRLARGVYVGPTTVLEDLAAAASGDLDLPIHDDPNRAWDGDGAKKRILAWATGEDGDVDPARLASVYFYRDEEADPATASAYKLPFADIIDGEPHIIAKGVYAVANVLQGGMGGVDLPEDDRDAIKNRVETLYSRLAKKYGDDSLRPPWDGEDQEASLAELEASAWSAMRDIEPMPATWFREPTPEELPPGSGGVHYAKGRVYGWVARTGEPHAGYPGKKITIESLGKLDLTHFLRARFPLDDGTTVRAGAFTMNVGHHRDGAQCETAACQFDDSGTVAGIVTVGMNAGGLWFSGAAAPWLSEWDRAVFAACQPSYHIRGPYGQRELRAVLTVPVPGHSSPLVATAVIDRSNLALAASAAVQDAPEPAADTPDTMSGQEADTGAEVSATASATEPPADADLGGQCPDTVPGHVEDSLSEPLKDIVASLLTDPAFVDQIAGAMEQREATRAEVERLTASVIAPARAEITTTVTEGAT
ncbi:phage minor head protein [Streptomyces roseifaciens]